jgi:hypothetical protein
MDAQIRFSTIHTNRSITKELIIDEDLLEEKVS